MRDSTIGQEADTLALNFWSEEVSNEIPGNFPSISILDLSEPKTHQAVLQLESLSYSDSGYGENAEGSNYFSRIGDYQNTDRLIHLGIWDEKQEKLLYYMDIYPLQPEERLFDEEFYNQLGTLKEDYLKLPGLVFNKIMRDPDFHDESSTASWVQIFLVKKLVTYSPKPQSIRIEERCQPDSFNKIISRFVERGFFRILVEDTDSSEAGVEVHQILIEIDPTQKVLRSLNIEDLSEDD